MSTDVRDEQEVIDEIVAAQRTLRRAIEDQWQAVVAQLAARMRRLSEELRPLVALIDEANAARRAELSRMHSAYRRRRR